MFKIFFSNKKGVTLLELIVSVGLFSFTMISATSIFKSVIDGQREAIVSQNMQESIRYAFERMSKEIRMANKDKTGVCTTAGDKVYDLNITEDRLFFLNYRNECVAYYLQDDRLYMSWDPDGPAFEALPLTPKDIKVKNLKFKVDDNIGLTQSQVTMTMDMEAGVAIEKNKQRLKMQTSISSRFYQ